MGSEPVLHFAFAGESLKRRVEFREATAVELPRPVLGLPRPLDRNDPRTTPRPVGTGPLSAGLGPACVETFGFCGFESLGMGLMEVDVCTWPVPDFDVDTRVVGTPRPYPGNCHSILIVSYPEGIERGTEQLWDNGLNATWYFLTLGSRGFVAVNLSVTTPARKDIYSRTNSIASTYSVIPGEKKQRSERCLVGIRVSSKRGRPISPAEKRKQTVEIT